VAEILLLPVSENKRPPYLNSISGFDFDLLIVVGMFFLHWPIKFHQNWASAADL